MLVWLPHSLWNPSPTHLSDVRSLGGCNAQFFATFWNWQSDRFSPHTVICQLCGGETTFKHTRPLAVGRSAFSTLMRQYRLDQARQWKCPEISRHIYCSVSQLGEKIHLPEIIVMKCEDYFAGSSIASLWNNCGWWSDIWRNPAYCTEI